MGEPRLMHNEIQNCGVLRDSVAAQKFLKRTRWWTNTVLTELFGPLHIKLVIDLKIYIDVLDNFRQYQLSST